MNDKIQALKAKQDRITIEILREELKLTEAARQAAEYNYEGAKTDYRYQKEAYDRLSNDYRNLVEENASQRTKLHEVERKLDLLTRGPPVDFNQLMKMTLEELFPDLELREKFKKARANRERIECIKLIRTSKNAGLKDAKDCYEQGWEQNGF